MKKFAFVFPGQGSQSEGMLDAWGDHPAVMEVVQEASEALSQDIGKLISHGTKEELALTTNTQPVMLVAAVAAYRAWRYEGGAPPDQVGGHSLGEYSALVVAGALELSTAAPLVRYRAQCMQEAVPVGDGAMAAILGLAADKVVSVCAEITASFSQNSGHIPQTVEAANFNDPLQTVIAGTKLAVERACEALKAAGAKRALLLQVSAPFHSRLMRPAADKLRERLGSIHISKPLIPVINNVDVAVEFDGANIKDALYRQAFGSVRWVETITKMQAEGLEAVIECGPGKVLTAMTKRISPDMAANCLLDPLTLAEIKNNLLI